MDTLLYGMLNSKIKDVKESFPLKLTGGFKIDMSNAEPALNGMYLRAYDYMEPSYFTGADILIETSIGVKKLCIIDKDIANEDFQFPDGYFGAAFFEDLMDDGSRPLMAECIENVFGSIPVIGMLLKDDMGEDGVVIKSGLYFMGQNAPVDGKRSVISVTKKDDTVSVSDEFKDYLEYELRLDEFIPENPFSKMEGYAYSSGNLIPSYCETILKKAKTAKTLYLTYNDPEKGVYKQEAIRTSDELNPFVATSVDWVRGYKTMFSLKIVDGSGAAGVIRSSV